MSLQPELDTPPAQALFAHQCISHNNHGRRQRDSSHQSLVLSGPLTERICLELSRNAGRADCCVTQQEGINVITSLSTF